MRGYTKQTKIIATAVPATDGCGSGAWLLVLTNALAHSEVIDAMQLTQGE